MYKFPSDKMLPRQIKFKNEKWDFAKNFVLEKSFYILTFICSIFVRKVCLHFLNQHTNLYFIANMTYFKK
jgi:hypothetical protein